MEEVAAVGDLHQFVPLDGAQANDAIPIDRWFLGIQVEGGGL
jgi:hypothetical protein